MIRTLNIILVVTSIFALVGVYALKFSVSDTAEQKTALERQIDRQEAGLSLLKADWAFLNQPANIAPVVTRHVADLNLQPLSQDQFGNFSILPMRLKAPDAQGLDSLFQSLDQGVDPITQIIKESN